MLPFSIKNPAALLPGLTKKKKHFFFFIFGSGYIIYVKIRSIGLKTKNLGLMGGGCNLK